MSVSSFIDKIKSKNIKYNNVSSDTRTLKKGNIFFAIPGSKHNGSKFIKKAIKKDAAAIVVPNNYNGSFSNKIKFFKVKDIRKELSLSAFSINKNKIKTKIAITGTNGKTSVAFFLNYLLKNSGKKVAMIGTLGNSLSQKKNYNNLTSPEPINLSKQLKRLSSQNIEYLIMEASSHGLDQKRFFGLKFDICALTNISHDHLDYHKTMHNYIKSKMLLFSDYAHEQSKFIINYETKNIKKIKSFFTKKNIIKPIYFQSNKNYKILKINNKNDKQFVDILIEGRPISLTFKNFPDFQIKNFVFAVSILSLLGFNAEKLAKKSINCPSVTGRMEYIGRTKTGGLVYIDFAHTPDALKNSIIETYKFKSSSIYVIFGCGGNRDQKKRPLMGKIAAKYADKVVVTDDNPRFENPASIRKEIIGNLKNITEVGNRKLAIKRTIQSLKKGDLLLIAGKGHEKFQSIKGKNIPFDDAKIASQLLK